VVVFASNIESAIVRGLGGNTPKELPVRGWVNADSGSRVPNCVTPPAGRGCSTGLGTGFDAGSATGLGVGFGAICTIGLGVGFAATFAALAGRAMAARAPGLRGCVLVAARAATAAGLPCFFAGCFRVAMKSLSFSIPSVGGG
jgi:hypothetical protein